MDQSTIDLLLGNRQVMRISNLESTIKKWTQPGTAGDSGGPNNLPHGTSQWTPAGTPAGPVLAKSGIFSFAPVKRASGQPWDTFYNSNDVVFPAAAQIPPDCFSYSIDVCLPTAADITADHAHEWEIEICEAGLCYNMAWQDNGKEFRKFDQRNQNWVSVPGLPAPTRKVGNFVSHDGIFSIDRKKKTVTHEGIFIDGIYFNVGMSALAVQRWPTNVFYLHNAFQFDSDGKGSKCNFLLKNISVAQL